ncbi:MAG: hypothetical protein JW821_17970, partial [Deltaproteobacteria bacterium]|nr:hypothetical protein [Deltaproteobacteria bacterium]
GAESFDLVAAVNLLDSLRLPLILLGQADALLRPGGRLILSSPYEWREEICDPGQWLEAADMDSPAVIRGILEGRLMPETGIHYRVAEEHMDVPWVLRNHRHSWALFMDHVLLATKRDAGGEV